MTHVFAAIVFCAMDLESLRDEREIVYDTLTNTNCTLHATLALAQASAILAAQTTFPDPTSQEDRTEPLAISEWKEVLPGRWEAEITEPDQDYDGVPSKLIVSRMEVGQ